MTDLEKKETGPPRMHKRTTATVSLEKSVPPWRNEDLDRISQKIFTGFSRFSNLLLFSVLCLYLLPADQSRGMDSD